MKRLIALAIAALIVLGSAGCSVPGQNEPTQSGGTTTQTQTPTSNTGTTGGTAGNTAGNTAQPANQGAADKIFRYSYSVDIATLDPGKINAMADATVAYHYLDPLYRNIQGVYEPATAESYDVSDDGVTYTFHLRKDTKWSDGQSVTAHDFEYGIKRICDPDAASPMSYLMDVVKNGTAAASGKVSLDEVGVKALDDYTLQITLQYPSDYFLGMLSMSVFEPVRKDLVEKYGAEFGSAADKMAYNGPFKVTQYGEGRLVMEKNENYYDADKIKLDGVEILTVADGSTAASLYEAGDLDYVEVNSDLASSQYAGMTSSYYSGADDYAALNHNNKYLANKNFRLAMNYAIDREEYILLSHNGLYKANQRYVLPQVHGAVGDYGDEYPLEAFPLKADVAKAQEYLAAAQAELGFANPSDITLKLVVTDSEVAKRESEIVANMWQNNLGIKIDINLVPGATRNAMLVANNNDFDIIMTGWVPDYSDPYSYLELWYGPSSYNYLNYHSDTYDGYLEASRTQTGKARMDSLFGAEKTLLEDGALVPLQLREVHYLVSNSVSNLQLYFMGYNMNYVYADKN
jgi:oligopeptide transport system substrate-binding protein